MADGTCPKQCRRSIRWWTVAAFRAYAAHTRTEEFQAGLAELLLDVDRSRVAVMCSETLWWRCHRRLIADVVLGRAARPVAHLMPPGTTTEHRLSQVPPPARAGY